MDRKIHIAHIVTSFDIGGLENGIVNLLNYMNRDVFDFSVCAFGNTVGASKERIRRQDVRYHTLDKREGNDVRLPFRLANVLKSQGTTIVHTHSWGTYIEGLVAAKLSRSPFMVHGEHGTILFDRFRRKQAFRLAASRTDQFLTVSQELADVLVEQVGIREHKVQAIINGVDTAKFQPDGAARSLLRGQMGLNHGDVLVGSVGRLVPIKDYPSLLNAFARVMRKEPNVHGALIGDGPQRNELEQQAISSGLASRFHFLGERNDIPAWLNALDVFVLPSIHEGISNTILEAMATGLPIVATRVGGNPEIVCDEGNGFLVPSQDPGKLAHALTILAENEETRHQFAEASLRRAQEHFSLQRMVDEYEALYLRLVERKR